MLLYCTSIWLTCPFDRVVDEIGNWLSFKVHDSVDRLHLVFDYEYHYSTMAKVYNSDQRFLHTVDSVRWTQNYPIMQSITYRHPDSEVRGRFWRTAIGIHQPQVGADIECTILLETEEQSVQVEQTARSSRPKLVYDLITNCSPSPRTAGTIHTVLESDLRELRDLIDDTRRNYPIILVDPHRTESYMINSDDLYFRIAGVADIYQIDSTVRANQLWRYLGTHTPSDGAVHILYPPVTRSGNFYVPTTRYRADDIRLIQSATETTFDQEVLDQITHRMNRRNLQRHINAEMVREQKRQNDLRTLRQKDGDRTEYVYALEEDNEKLRQEIRMLKATIEDGSMHEIELEDKIEDLERQVKNYQTSIDEMYAQRSTTEDVIKLREAYTSVLMGNPTLENCLKVIDYIFSDRLIVLETAYRSAREAAIFRKGKDAFDLMLKMMTLYWEAMCNGIGDHEARSIFGHDKFAARESENVERNKRAQELRTFPYKGQDVTMWRHLKIGVSENMADTFRCHFHWDADAQKIVIGHCGKHLDHD